MLAALRAHVSGDDAFLARLVQIYLDALPDRLARLEAATEAGDLDTLEQVAHALKSNSAMLGAERVSTRSADLERLARADHAEAARRTASALVRAMIALRPRLLRLRDHLASS
jgi:HPt (histidine-containing phosphotransfer) domain-containing protein